MATGPAGGSEDPWNKQYSMLRLGLISSCIFVTIILVVALSRNHGLGLALGIAVAWVVLDSFFIYFVLRSVRRKRANGSDRSGGMRRLN
jgi:hypothetical protein